MADTNEDVLMEEQEQEQSKEEEKVEEGEDLKMEDAEEKVKEEEAEAEAETAEAAEPEGKDENWEAPQDTRAKVDPASVFVSSQDATMNVMSLTDGKLLTSLSDGGARYLLAGARATAGMKGGRYYFEVRILETLRPSNPNNASSPKPLLRLGFSTSGSSLLTNGQESLTVDTEGSIRRGEAQVGALSCGFKKGDVVAAVLNLADGTPGKNTLSFFCNGQRMGPPHALPGDMLGKALFPTVTFKVMTIQVNLGPTPLKKLPFNCSLLAEAAEEDLEIRKVGAAMSGSDKKAQLIVPIGLPNRGYFDLVDQLKKANPGIHEVSESGSLEWLAKSGLRGRRRTNDPLDSIDAPRVEHNIAGLDDGSLRSVLLAHLTGCPRDVIMPAAVGNMLREQREATLRHFPSSSYKRIAVIALGDPNDDFKTFVQAQALEDKKAQKEQRKRNKQDGRLQYDLRRKQAELGRRRKDALARGEEFDEVGAALELGIADFESDDDDGPVTLTEKEMATVFRKRELPEANEKTVNKAFAKFSVPGADGNLEGFDEVKFIWSASSAEASAEWLRNWILQKKMSERAEDLVAGEWFKTQMKQFQEFFINSKRRQNEAKDPQKLKAYLAKKKESAEGEAAEAEAKIEIDLDDVDVHGVEDVMDIGDGRPLFIEFAYEDWTLLTTGFELHALLHGFKKDLNDPDRRSFKEADLQFYYNLYHKKPLNFKVFGNEEFSYFLELFKDVVTVEAETGFLLPLQSDQFAPEKLLRIVEDNRRERQSTIDAGDETARLTFTRPSSIEGKGGKGGDDGHEHGQGGGRREKWGDKWGGDKWGDRDDKDWKGDKGGKYGKGGKGGKKGKSYGTIAPTSIGGKGGKGQKRSYDGNDWPSSKKGGGKRSSYHSQGGYYGGYKGYD